MSGAVGAQVRIRSLRAEDLDQVVRIDAGHTGRRKPSYWDARFRDFLGGRREPLRVGLAAESDGLLVGYLLGEVRAFEFGSEPCGWIFAVGVAPHHVRAGIATRLLEEACRRFREAGIQTARTMIRRDDVPVLSFFRASRFVGGRFVQLERDLTVAP
jgi:ribosomal protein S18 acetylase RimI-like enzyme